MQALNCCASIPETCTDTVNGRSALCALAQHTSWRSLGLQLLTCFFLCSFYPGKRSLLVVPANVLHNWKEEVRALLLFRQGT